jgi:6-phosphogluconolactonase
MLSERQFSQASELADALAETIAGRLESAVRSRGRALLAVSGGSSPKQLFNRLARVDVQWRSVTVTLVDERWVPPEHADSNARLVREHLLVGTAAAASFQPLFNGTATPAAAIPACQAALAELPLPFDVIVLGMGEDGHTASLFPRADGLSRALDEKQVELCAAIDPPEAPHPRITLTLRALLCSRVLILPLNGAAKRATYMHALLDGPTEALPIRAILRQDRVPVEVWYSL